MIRENSLLYYGLKGGVDKYAKVYDSILADNSLSLAKKTIQELPKVAGSK
jgi:hypothetical protein